MQPDPTKNHPHGFNPFKKLGEFDRSVVSTERFSILFAKKDGETDLLKKHKSPREYFDNMTEFLKREYKSGTYNCCIHGFIVSNVSMEETAYNVEVVESEIMKHLRAAGFHTYTSFCHSDKSECLADIPVYCHNKRTSTGPACFECDTIVIHCCIPEE